MECDAMSNDTTFEELEKTAFEFAKAMSANESNSGISIKAMQLAKEWHQDKKLRESWFVSSSLKESDWIKIDVDYDSSDFQKDDEYWVVRGAENPFKAKIKDLDTIGGRTQPSFYLAENPISYFPVTAFLPKVLGDKILDSVAPDHPMPEKYSYSNSYSLNNI